MSLDNPVCIRVCGLVQLSELIIIYHQTCPNLRMSSDLFSAFLLVNMKNYLYEYLCNFFNVAVEDAWDIKASSERKIISYECIK